MNKNILFLILCLVIIACGGGAGSSGDKEINPDSHVSDSDPAEQDLAGSDSPDPSDPDDQGADETDQGEEPNTDDDQTGGDDTDPDADTDADADTDDDTDPETDEPLLKPLGTGYFTAYITGLFMDEFEEVGEITAEKFSEIYDSETEYIDSISWDITKAAFWDRLNSDPKDLTPAPYDGYIGPADGPAAVLTDFRLNSEELAIIKEKGFVVSERLGAHSFAELYYRIFYNDMPVFVSTDSILHAWHASFSNILEEMELSYLSPMAGRILDRMHARIPDLWTTYENSALKESIKDVDVFLTVARSLLKDSVVASHLAQDGTVTNLLDKIKAELFIQSPTAIFGCGRYIDFTQFKPRGHYTEDVRLERYFRSMMWLAKANMSFRNDYPQQCLNQAAGAAVVLNELLDLTESRDSWRSFEEVLQVLVGKSDNMTFDHLDRLLSEENILSLDDLTSDDALRELTDVIVSGETGVQEIQGDPDAVASDSRGEQKLPVSFAVMGQKFILDSWAMSKVVSTERPMTSGLDVVFSVFGNDQVVPELYDRMTATDGEPFRDGINYQRELSAVRTVIDDLDDELWEESIYAAWLKSLRALSEPTIGSEFPEAMQTRSWAAKTVNTQLASWTELRHDTVLYGKQSFMGGLCYYPAGLVEPRIAFWNALENMVNIASTLLNGLSMTDGDLNFGSRKAKIVGFLDDFSDTVVTIREIAEAQQAHQELTAAQVTFLDNVIEILNVYGGPKQYNGWYPQLFYGMVEESDSWVALVSDVHTVSPNDYLPMGRVLHEGVGNVNLLVIGVNHDDGPIIYLGPTMSHYEFSTDGNTRLNDDEWKTKLKQGTGPSVDLDFLDYVVPGKPEKIWYR